MNKKWKYLIYFGLPLILLTMTASNSVAASLYSLLKKLEENDQVKLNAYDDGGGVATIGWGSTYNWDAKRPVKFTDKITKDTADRWLKIEADQKLNDVKSLVKVPINNNQLVALASFTYNVGTSAFKNSTLLRLINAGADKNFTAMQFDRWVYDNGRFVQGLKNRRDIEKKLFLS